MNKSKILKKSLAMLLAIMMIVVAIPMSAAAAGTHVVTDVKVIPCQDGDGLLGAPDTWSPDITLTKSGNTFTGNIPNTLTRFSLSVVSNMISGGNLAVKDMNSAGNRTDFFADQLSGNYISETADLTGTFVGDEIFGEGKLAKYTTGDKINITLYARDDSGEVNEYNIILTKVADPAISGSPIIKEMSLIRQLGDSVIDNVNRTVTIEVPMDENMAALPSTAFDMDKNFLKSLTLSGGAKAYYDGDSTTWAEEFTNYSIATGDELKYTSTGTDPHFIVTGNASASAPKNRIKLTGNGETVFYEIIIKRSTGLRSFSFEGASENFVDDENGIIYVRFPYDYLENQSGNSAGEVTLTANFSTQYSGVKVYDAKDNLLTSGTSKVKEIKAQGASNIVGPATAATQPGSHTKSRLVSSVASTSTYHMVNAGTITLIYDELKPLLDQKTELAALYAVATPPTPATTIKVKYSSESEREYKVYLLEPALNTENKIDSFSIGNYNATIDQDAKTIDITLPRSYEGKTIAASEVSAEGSRNAAVVAGPYDSTAGAYRYLNMQLDYEGYGEASRNVATDATRTNYTPIPSDIDSDLGASLPTTVDFTAAPIKINVFSELAANTAMMPSTIACSQFSLVNVLNQTTAYTPQYAQYTLNISYSDITTTDPRITSMSLRDEDGNLYRATIDQATQTITFTDIPYSAKFPTVSPVNQWDNVDNWQLFYTVSEGTEVLYPLNPGAETGPKFMRSGARLTPGIIAPVPPLTLPTPTGSMSTIWPVVNNANANANNGVDEGALFPVQSLDFDPGTTGTGAGTRKMYKIVIGCADPHYGTEIESFNATNAGGSAGVSGVDGNPDFKTDTNVYPGKVNTHVGATPSEIVIEIPNKAYNDPTMDPTTGLYSIINFTSASEGAVAYLYDGTSNLTRVLNCEDDNDPDDIAGSRLVFPTPLTDELNLWVISESYAARYLSDTSTYGYTPFADPFSTGSGTLPDPSASELKIYKVKVKEMDPKTGAQLSTVELYDATGKKVDVDLTIAGGSINGTIPWSVANRANGRFVDPFFLKFTASPNATVTDSGVVGAPVASLYASQYNSDGWKYDIDDDDEGNVYDTTSYGTYVAPNFISTMGNIGLTDITGSAGSTAAVTASDGTTPGNSKIQVISENSTAYAEYSWNLTVAQPSSEALIKSFSVGGVDGVIDQTGKKITVTMPYGTEVTSMIPKFEASDYALVKTANDGLEIISEETAVNFSQPVTMVVQAENGAESRYAVTINVRTDFTDVFETDWFYTEVMAAAKAGYVNGYEDGSFRPNNNITRGEFTTMLARAMAADLTSYKDTTAFPDVNADAYYSASIAWAADNGMVLGFDDGEFKAEQQITREQMAVIIARSKNLHPILAPKTRFADDSTIADWSKPYVYACKEADILLGYDDNRFGPQDNTLRCQAAAVFVRSYLNK